MSCGGLVDRVTLRWGGISLTGDTIALGVPGPATSGGFAFPARDSAQVPSPASAAQDSYQKIILSGQGNVRGIAIAPDSAIECCDVALAGRDGEMQRHRISPGNPLLGSLHEYDSAFISIPNCIPKLTALASSVHWDASDVAFVSGGANLQGFPLRLELWRGDVVPVRANKRAPYYAHIVFQPEATSTNTGDVVVCVDGRRKVSIVASTDADTTTVSVKAIHSVKSSVTLLDNPIEVTLPVDAAGNTSLAINAATPGAIITYDGVPMQLLRISISQATNAARVQLHVSAWD